MSIILCETFGRQRLVWERLANVTRVASATPLKGTGGRLGCEDVGDRVVHAGLLDKFPRP